jgi:ABC-2 type transport system ATP-binding protein
VSGVAVVEARGLSKCYGRQTGIVDVDLTVSAGDVLGLVGANGAGKTTFIRTLLGFIRPTSGSLRVFGLDSVRDSVEIRRRTAYLPGTLVLPPRLRAIEALQRYLSCRPSEDADRIPALAERVGLELDRRIGDLSKGNKQKVGLVLAFAPHAELVVLDEPTSGLDPLLQRLFTTLVAERAREGTTVVLSSHVMSEVEHVAGRVALMRKGRIAAVDEMSAIRAQARRRGCARPRNIADLARLAAALVEADSVTDVVTDGDTVTFACAGDMDAAVKTLAGFAMASLDIVHTDLEDVFFSTYDAPPEHP